MKTSNKILIVASIIPVLLFLGISISLRIAFENSAYTDAEGLDSGAPVSREYELKGFDKLFINGAWNIRVLQGSDYHVVIKAPENIFNFVSVKNIGDNLILNHFSGYQQLDGEYALNVEISIPSVSGITVLGSCHLDLTGFRQDYLGIEANGATRISISNTQLTNLNLKGQGVAEWDLSQASTKNATVDYSGKFSIALSMNGGKLAGNLDGVGELTYTGEADTKEIKIKSPLSQIIHQQDF